ncbi:MAG: hypothetical protein NTY90_05590 [Candidatus Micrarchaeota archaeon]|nr:hypothetical protein [Candidatus Micrarchaeota archaeon]
MAVPKRFVFVDSRDYLSTHARGLDDLQDYENAHRMWRNGARVSDIAMAVKRDSSTVVDWLKRGRMPKSVKGLREISHLLPLTLDHPLMPRVNTLAAWAFASGNVKGGKRRYAAYLNAKKEQFPELSRVLHGLGLEPVFSRPGRQTIRLGEKSSHFARIMHALGLPASERKARQELALPAYLTRLSRGLLHNTIAKKREARARALVQDFVAVLLANKLNRVTQKHWVLRMHYSPTQKAGERLGRQALEAMQAAAPELGLGAPSLRVVHDKAKKRWQPHIVLDGKAVGILEKKYPRLLKYGA